MVKQMRYEACCVMRHKTKSTCETGVQKMLMAYSKSSQKMAEKKCKDIIRECERMLDSGDLRDGSETLPVVRDRVLKLRKLTDGKSQDRSDADLDKKLAEVKRAQEVAERELREERRKAGILEESSLNTEEDPDYLDSPFSTDDGD
mmetsp:Transcript_68016/g.107882  ORF Transcript_68016/g.107882 Transcript_68016/m.107882 type:complete len:146 (+) Transcript_68016:71-508(+)